MAYSTAEENATYQKKYREQDREAYLAYRRSYYEKNRDKLLNRQKEWYSVNRKKKKIDLFGQIEQPVLPLGYKGEGMCKSCAFASFKLSRSKLSCDFYNDYCQNIVINCKGIKKLKP